MAYDEGLAEEMRAALADVPGLSEKRMFGGLCFLLDGHMVCGVTADGAMFRPGKAAEAEALALPGVRPLSFTGRKMGGMVETGAEALGDTSTLARLVALSLAHSRSLPPK